MAIPLHDAHQPHGSLPPSNVESRKVDEYGAFDVLRFALAATVTLSHVGLFSWNRSGNLAVQVFFALSGWLIGTILNRTKAQSSAASTSIAPPVYGFPILHAWRLFTW